MLCVLVTYLTCNWIRSLRSSRSGEGAFSLWLVLFDKPTKNPVRSDYLITNKFAAARPRHTVRGSLVPLKHSSSGQSVFSSAHSLASTSPRNVSHTHTHTHTHTQLSCSTFGNRMRLGWHRYGYQHQHSINTLSPKIFQTHSCNRQGMKRWRMLKNEGT